MSHIDLADLEETDLRSVNYKQNLHVSLKIQNNNFRFSCLILIISQLFLTQEMRKSHQKCHGQVFNHKKINQT